MERNEAEAEEGERIKESFKDYENLNFFVDGI